MIAHKVILRVILFLAYIALSHAANAYIYYKDASCGSDGSIQGDLYYVWDTKSMRGHGRYIPNYSGSCKYFKDGIFNPEFQTGTESYMLNGYCITCKGTIGCTSKKYSCQNFHTIIPTKTTYKLSYSSTSTTDEEASDEQNIEYLQKIAEEIYNELQASNTNTTYASYMYNIAGAMIAVVSMMSMVIMLRKYRRHLRLKGAVDPRALTEQSSVHV